MEGTPFGRYQLIELLGRGGMGEVWRAHDTAIDRMVALKMLLPQFSQDKAYERRFLREARAAAGLDDPNVVPIHDVGEIAGRLYLTMQLVTGPDLQSVLDRGGPLAPERAVGIIGQVASALDAAHAVGLVHRDVKPSNVLLGDGDFAYLIDFGIARSARETGLTNTGAMVGTWAYMAPERFVSSDIDPRSDTYALACVLHQCVTGRQPFGGDSVEQLIAAHMFTPPPRPSLVHRGVPEALDRVIATGMSKDPAQRYPRVTDLAAAAHAALVSSTPPSTWRPTGAPPGPMIVGAQGAVWAGEPTGRRSFAAPSVAAEAARLAPAGDAQQRPRMWRRKAIVIPAAVMVVSLIATVAVILANPTTPPPPITTPGQFAEPVTYGRQIELPFTELNRAAGVAVDADGAVYITDVSGYTYIPHRVLRMAPDATAADLLPFTEILSPESVAVDADGVVYVGDTDHAGTDRVLTLAPGTTTQGVLPIADLWSPSGVAVDSGGNVYVVDTMNSRVRKLVPGGRTADVLPFTGLDRPHGVAVDAAGVVYVTDTWNDRVLRLIPGAQTADVLPFTGLHGPSGIAVDVDGAVYIADFWNDRVLKLVPGAQTADVLPFTGLTQPEGVAVDAGGSIYLTDHRRVLKLPVN